MDTREDTEIKEAKAAGHPQTDEGPYYHGSWWESYKGGVKGKLGGVAIGALLGATVGIAAAAVISLAIPVSFIAITAGFAAGGMLYGAHEFGEVGKITGAVASAHEKSEERMKSFENSKFLEIKKEINELKALVTGKPVEEIPEATAEKAQLNEHGKDYDTQHSDESKGFKPIFWKIAAIGLAVGLAVGGILAAGGVTEHLLGHLGSAGESLAHAGVSPSLVTMGALGLFGASFGINRDLFRGVFDRTDHLFRGIISPSKSKTPELSQEPVITAEKLENPITTVVYEGYADYPQSDTHHRDKVLTQAKQALLSMDHTKAIPH